MNAPAVHALRPARNAHLRGWLLAVSLCVVARASAQEASSTVYIRTDTDHTTVVTPRVRVAANVDPATRVDLSYSADVWTSASIDIRTSASKAVTEQRDELVVSAAHELDDGSLSMSYRFSTEPDYKSHGITLGTSRDFAQKNTTLALSASALFDHVGRAGDPGFSRSMHTFVVRASGTQLLDDVSWLQGIYELSYADGYLASPYRFIAIGPGIPRCSDAGAVCVRETLPGERVRHALALIARRGLSERVALGASYRFYVDGWGLLANTAQGTFSVMPGHHTRLSLDYRFYTQTAARYYRASVPSLAALGRFTTRDKELSPFMSHALALTLDHAIMFGTTGALHLATTFGPTLYLFQDFPAYNQLRAFETTVSVRVEL